ncbi:MAG: wax ester/triacylglycerol synthase family O-acyltransferase [Pseudomonadales bacterium]|jgi:WS/DGAT/MGAT family acyltransferase|nr:wax ester/triacylglycerol synthase family O-acyltransferase [Pseudomonadales bacterium]
MNKLKLLDASFLYAETASTPMHIAGLQHFEVPPDRAGTFFEDLKAYIAARVHLVPFMTRRLRPTPLGIDHPVWVADDAFDIDHHVQRLRVPSPGTQKQLEQTVARLHEMPMDRSRPLWQFWLLEGLESGHVAWYTKYHHACIDGMAGQAIIDLLFTDTPEVPPAPVPGGADASPTPGLFAMLWDTAKRAGTQPLRTARELPGVARMAWRLGSRAFEGSDGLGALGQRAPRTRFNGAIGPYRNYAIGSLPLAAVKALGKPHGCKVNDVFMAVCAGGLASYLAERGELPTRPLIAGAPVSLRQAGDQSMSNQVTMLLTSLETQRADPLARMLAIRDSAERGKGVVGDLQGASLDDLSIPGLPLAFRGAMALAERLRLGDFLPMPLNLVISNVPGPRREVFLAGARMLTHFPVSIPAHGAAVNITVQSYGDRLDFSLTTCLDTVPDTDRLRDHLLDAWVALQKAANGGLPLVPALPVDPVADTAAQADDRAA